MIVAANSPASRDGSAAPTGAPPCRSWVGASLIAIFAILVSAIVVSDGFGGDVHASEGIVPSNIRDNKAVRKLSPVNLPWLNPILIFELSDKEHRDNVHLSVQQHVIILKIASIYGYCDRLFSSNRPVNSLRFVEFQKIERVSNFCTRTLILPH
jgi:hypothetical protein